MKYLFAADEDWKEDPGEEAVRCPDEANVLRSVCGGRGERFLNIKNKYQPQPVRTPGPSPPPSTE